MDTPSYKLVLEEDMNLDELKHCVEGGYRFLVFRYDIGIFVMSFRLFSPAILVPPDKSVSKYAKPYNIITSLIGWFCIPLGPLTAAKTLLFNNGGGVDVTRDVMLNIDDSALAQRVVSTPITHTLFSIPNKADSQEVHKAIQKDFEGDPNLKLLVFGLFVNTNEPYFTIGLKVDRDHSEYQNKVLKSLYRKFRKTTHFEFLSQDEYPLEFGLLVEQGRVIYADPSIDLDEIIRSSIAKDGKEASAIDANSLKSSTGLDEHSIINDRGHY